VMMLRRIEYHPSSAPRTLAAIRSLERARKRHASRMLFDSRNLLDAEKRRAPAEKQVPRVTEAREERTFAQCSPLSAISAPPPISQVLSDIYQDETRVTN
jgi:hypothetical protein